jgi:N-acetyl-gamma-glutamyl-phosphate reductase
MTRGIMITSYANIKEGMLGSTKVIAEHITEIYREFYDKEPFVTMVYNPPQTKETWGSNQCLVYTTVDERTNRLIVISCIDNLVKGAAGQAIQNMNLMQGYPEVMGLNTLAVYP